MATDHNNGFLNALNGWENKWWSHFVLHYKVIKNKGDYV